MALLAHANVLNGDMIEALSFEKQQLYVPFILAAYTTGQLLSFISSVFIEKYTIWIIGYPSRYLLGFKCNDYFSTNNLVRLTVGVFLAPISIIELLFNFLLKYRSTYAKALDELLIEIITGKMKKLLAEKSGLSSSNPHLANSDYLKNSDFFRFTYHYAVESAPNHYPKMQNYVAIYGFLRTMTLISVLFFWAAVWHTSTSGLTCYTSILILIAMSLLSFTFYMAFVKFWRRFTLEAMMAIATTYEIT